MDVPIPNPHFPLYATCYPAYCDHFIQMVEEYPEAIKQEFQTLEAGSASVNHTMKAAVAYLPHNIHKNRDLNFVPFYGHMVVLDQRDGFAPAAADGHINASMIVPRDSYPPEAAEGYINASTIKTCSSEKVTQFIATQDPLPETCEDFWMMVLQKRCPAIVMLSHKEDKCHDYFPASDGQEVLFGNICVTFMERIRSRFITISRLEVKYNESEEAPHSIMHIQYAAWPDKGVPESTQFVREIIEYLLRLTTSGGPVVVHCRAGSGRTGTYCTIHSIIQRILIGDFSDLDVHKVVSALRSQRFGMVQNEVQYTFCYEAITEELKVRSGYTGPKEIE